MEMGIDRIQSLKRYIGEAADEELEAAFSQLKLARCPTTNRCRSEFFIDAQAC
jgi:hypothetical protein